MPRRITILAVDEVYHVLNRGVASNPIFHTIYDYKRFINLIKYYRYSKTPLSFSKYLKIPIEERLALDKHLAEKEECLVEIYSYCLMPNHFHLLLRQNIDKGIQIMLSNIQNGYCKYFNIRNERSGPLFQSRFKAKHIENDQILLHVSRYVHLNPATSYIIKIETLSDYQWSSYPLYIENKSSFVNSKLILKLAGGVTKYKQFVLDHADYQKKLAKIKYLILEK